MMDERVLVYVDLSGAVRLAGRLWSHARGRRESATFEYAPQWLSCKERFALEPALSLSPGPFHSRPDQTLFGALGDSAPDRWGRALMRRAERRRAEKAGETPSSLREIDYLLLVDDELRQGALRFARQEEGPFLAEPGEQRIPPLVALPRLLSAAERVASDAATDEDLRLLLAPGSSLGGARPKASVRDRDGHLLIAKFPKRDDEVDIVLWEGLALRLAQVAGIEVANWRLERPGGRAVLLLRRFDREDQVRIPFLSALSMLSAADNEQRSYLEIVEALRRNGAQSKKDSLALWRRIVFNILISNTDDHLRNHGFLYGGAGGWRLSPAYDLNPTPTDIKPRVLSTSINYDDSEASVELALSVAEDFGVPPREARKGVGELSKTVRTWRKEAGALGLTRAEQDRMASAFALAEERR